MFLALDLAWASAGSSIAAKMAMMAMTTKSSINVKPAAAPCPAPGTDGRFACMGVIRCPGVSNVEVSDPKGKFPSRIRLIPTGFALCVFMVLNH